MKMDISQYIYIYIVQPYYKYWLFSISLAVVVILLTNQLIIWTVKCIVEETRGDAQYRNI